MDLSAGVSYFLGRFDKALLAPGSQISLVSLSCALLTACAFIAARRYRQSRRIRARTLMRALFPRHIMLSRSALTDFGYLYFNIFVFGLVFGWALLSYEMLSRTIVDQLTALFGPMPPAPLPTLVSRTIITVMLFLAYELGYWLNHYLSQRIPFLWEFHKVHHTPTVLTPVTNFRVHPVYMCIFLNVLAGLQAASASTSWAGLLINTGFLRTTSSLSFSSMFMFTCSIRRSGSHLPDGWAGCS